MLIPVKLSNPVEQPFSTLLAEKRCASFEVVYILWPRTPCFVEKLHLNPYAWPSVDDFDQIVFRLAKLRKVAMDPLTILPVRKHELQLPVVTANAMPPNIVDSILEELGRLPATKMTWRIGCVQVPASEMSLCGELFIAKHDYVCVTVLSELGTNEFFDRVATGQKPCEVSTRHNFTQI